MISELLPDRSTIVEQSAHSSPHSCPDYPRQRKVQSFLG